MRDFTILIFLLISCERVGSMKIIKSIQHDNIEFIWYRDYCGSNGCDFVMIKNKSKEITIYHSFYDNTIKDINFKNDTFIVYHSENLAKEDKYIYLQGEIWEYNVKFIPVPSHWCNYLQIIYNNCKCNDQPKEFFEQTPN